MSESSVESTYTDRVLCTGRALHIENGIEWCKKTENNLQIDQSLLCSSHNMVLMYMPVGI